MNTKEWRLLLRNLRLHYPVAGGVVVRRRNVKCDCGFTTFDGRNYFIRVNSSQPYTGQIDTLLHEWAHVQAIEQAYRHEGPWGTMYASIYDSWVKNFEKKR